MIRCLQCLAQLTLPGYSGGQSMSCEEVHCDETISGTITRDRTGDAESRGSL
jgi:hypothetical protein